MCLGAFANCWILIHFDEEKSIFRTTILKGMRTSNKSRETRSELVKENVRQDGIHARIFFHGHSHYYCETACYNRNYLLQGRMVWFGLTLMVNLLSHEYEELGSRTCITLTKFFSNHPCFGPVGTSIEVSDPIDFGEPEPNFQFTLSQLATTRSQMVNAAAV
jgi:hypothetical protein